MLEKRHSAKPASPSDETSCVLRCELHSAKLLLSVFRPLPSVVALGKVAESGSEAEEGALTILTQANDKARSYTREAMQVHPWFFLEQWSEVFSPWIIYSL